LSDEADRLGSVAAAESFMNNPGKPVPRRLSLFAVIFIAARSFAADAPLADAMREVERIRGLTFVREVRTESLDRSQLPERLREQIVKSLPYSIHEYTQILRALQLVEDGTEDLDEKLFDLLQSQVLAFYDPLTHVYYSIRQLPDVTKGLVDPSILVDSVMIHELTHALQDQRFNIGRTDLDLRNDWDASLAFHSVVEGEASLVMLASIVAKGGASLDDVIGSDVFNMIATATSADQMIDPTAPRYFVESLKFPYLEGMRFVVEAYRRGGWKEVDRIYGNPPRTSREILYPEEYFARTSPRERFTPAPPLPLAGPRFIEHMGEFHWRFLLGPDASRGWVNDRVTVALNRWCEPTVLVETKWDNEARADAFRQAYVAFLRGREIEPVVEVNGREVRVAYGADTALAMRFVAGPAVARR
jgi:hypothetical protein